MSDDALDLRELLGKPSAEYPDLPDLPPTATFYGKLINVETGLSQKKGTPYFRFNVRLTDPGKDVPEASLDSVKASGFSLADFNVYADMWLTANAMRQFRRFLDSLGFPTNVRMDEMLKLNPENFNPTDETQELFRGRDVLVRTGAMSERGTVFRNLDSIAGIKRQG